METDLPFFSVIVRTHDRPERLDRCLAALAKLSHPRDRFEMIVVDDGPFYYRLLANPLSLKLNVRSMIPSASILVSQVAVAKGFLIGMLNSDQTKQKK